MSSEASSSSWSGRLWVAGMGLFLAAAGVAFVWVLWTAWQRAEETRRWTAVPCRIVSAQIVEARPTPNSNPTYRTELRYRYRFGDQDYTGSRIKRVDAASQHEEIARKKLETYPIGQETVCYVDPAQPERAVLKHDTRAALYSLWFPALFVIGGLGMAFHALRRRS